MVGIKVRFEMRDYSSCPVVSKSNLSTISSVLFFFHLPSTDFIQDEGLDQVSIQPYNQPLPPNFKNFRFLTSGAHRTMVHFCGKIKLMLYPKDRNSKSQTDIALL